MKILISTFFLAALLNAQAPAAKAAPMATDLKAPPAAAAPGYESINEADCRTWLTRLASDEFEGRRTGTAGYQKAADMVAGLFQEFGLKAVADPGADGKPTYFQQVPFVMVGLDEATTSLAISGGKEPITPKIGEGFSATGGTALDVQGGVVFVLLKPRTRPKVDVEGKVVIAATVADDELGRLQGGPVRDLHDSGALAVIRIDDAMAARDLVPLDPVRRDHFKPGSTSRPVSYVSRDLARAIAKSAGRDFDEMVAKAGAADTPSVFDTKLTAKLKVGVSIKEVDAPNVVGYLEGSDPKLKSELVIIGSHLDHLGRSATGEINNGADDDGSGSTGVIAIARALTRNERAPARSVMFLLFCGEEDGLLGSHWYVNHPIFPNDKVTAELQMDMIGRREEAHPSENQGTETADDNVNTLHLVGSKRIAPELHELILGINAKHVGFEFEYDQEGVYGRSDHAHFASKGIPIAFFFTGFHLDYHKPTDDVEKIDFPKLARVAQLVYLTAWELAERPAQLPRQAKREERR